MAEPFKPGDKVKYEKAQFIVMKIVPAVNGRAVLEIALKDGSRAYQVWADSCELVRQTPKSLMTW